MVVVQAGAARAAVNAARGGARSASPADLAEKKKKEEEERKKKEEEEKPKSCPKRAAIAVMDFLDQTWLQTLQYMLFLFAFQSLTGTIRKPEVPSPSRRAPPRASLTARLACAGVLL